MDFIEQANEADTLEDHLQIIIGDALPYDSNKIYALSNIEVYIELNCVTPLYNPKDLKKWPQEKGYKNIDMKKSLIDVLTTPGYILPMVAEIVVVCKDSKQFYDSFL